MRTPWRFLSDLAGKRPSLLSSVDSVPDNKVLTVKVRVAETPLNIAPERSAFPLSVEEAGVRVEANRVVRSHVQPGSDHRNSPESQGELAELPGSSADDGYDAASKAKPNEAIEAQPSENSSNALHPNVTVDLIPEKPAAAFDQKTARSFSAAAGRSRASTPKPVIDLPSSRKRTTSEEMAELDVEIAELRQVLSLKLSTQNKQLRQLLRRFPD